MATAEECRLALESLLGHIRDLDPAERAANLVDREISCKVEDLGITFMTRLGPDGASPVTLANGSDPQAQVKLTTKSDDLLAIAEDPASFGRAWLTGRLKVDASIFDLLRLRKLL
jgi:predicted lipid carrier protein YhbT